MVQIFNSIVETAIDSNGDVISGAKLFIYEAGTTTKLTTYSDSALTIANANPLIADSAGRFVTIYGNPDDYKFVLTTAEDTDPPASPIKTTDNYNISSAAAFSGGINAGGYSEHLVNAQTGTSYTIVTGDRAKLVTHSNPNATAVTLPQANSSTFPAGWYYEEENEGAGLVTITPTTSTIGKEATFVLTRGQRIRVTSDGTNYSAVITGIPVGTVSFGYSSTAPQGHLLENGDTIGSASSGATKAGAIYEALYHSYWNSISDTYAAVSTGRGASAVADFAANKTLTIPDNDKRVPYGAGTSTTGETNGAATVASTGSVGTSGATTLTTAQVPAHINTIPTGGTVSAILTNTLMAATDASSVGNTNTNSSGGSGGSHTHTGGTYTGSASSVDQLGRVIYWYIKY